jgi:predicted site-specific integrase-resolvase
VFRSESSYLISRQKCIHENICLIGNTCTKNAVVLRLKDGDAKTAAAILVRVSTLKQETTRQVSELKSYAEAKHYAVVEVCEETISGTAENGQRHGLRRVEELRELANSRNCWFMRFRV